MRAKKSLGQHFLTSPHIVEKIIAASDLKKGDLSLEIGPGTGILTKKMLETGAFVIACEKDDRAIPILTEKFQNYIESGTFTLIHHDILTLDISKYGLKEGQYKLIANIPYYITGEILEYFLEKTAHPSEMVLMVQKEVADRIMARDGKESILSLSIKIFGKPQYISHVSRGSFNPPPNVDSAVIKISEISKKFFIEHQILTQDAFRIIKTGFAHKRKLLIKNLEKIFAKDKLESAWKETDLDRNIRAEDVSLEKWKTLIYILCK
ncbi:MAG: 16S rRNA (adenine(1518)-N(6)/adenine(1519)-N(6))-dimethyltransferase RsmA [Patescibacteria group bacterium]